jgi:3-hydroxyisobutyrate dehydrogenase-like beta-hydroxyacid dehydrogenase
MTKQAYAYIGLGNLGGALAACLLREGFEVHIEVDGEVLTFAELGFGDSALIERARALVEGHLKGTRGEE